MNSILFLLKACPWNIIIPTLRQGPIGSLVDLWMAIFGMASPLFPIFHFTSGVKLTRMTLIHFSIAKQCSQFFEQPSSPVTWTEMYKRLQENSWRLKVSLHGLWKDITHLFLSSTSGVHIMRLSLRHEHLHPYSKRVLSLCEMWRKST